MIHFGTIIREKRTISGLYRSEILCVEPNAKEKSSENDYKQPWRRQK